MTTEKTKLRPFVLLAMVGLVAGLVNSAILAKQSLLRLRNEPLVVKFYKQITPTIINYKTLKSNTNV